MKKVIFRINFVTIFIPFIMISCGIYQTCLDSTSCYIILWSQSIWLWTKKLVKLCNFITVFPLSLCSVFVVLPCCCSVHWWRWGCLAVSPLSLPLPLSAVLISHQQAARWPDEWWHSVDSNGYNSLSEIHFNIELIKKIK